MADIEYHAGWNYRLFAVLLVSTLLVSLSAFIYYSYEIHQKRSIAEVHFKEIDRLVEEMKNNGDISGLKLKFAKEHRKGLDDALAAADESARKKTVSLDSLYFGPASLAFFYYALVFIVTGKRPPLPTLRRPPR